MTTLKVFTDTETRQLKLLLAAKVASMMGRKMEEGDWSEVYCKVKDIPDSGWSNLHIDVNHNGIGIEFKMLRVPGLRGKSIKDICGTSRMHPSATRSIRIDDDSLPANEVMADVLTQYSDLIDERTERVKEHTPNTPVDMRFGWLLWEDGLREFLYFEESMTKPDPENYFAEWNERPAQGVRKGSKSLWIYDKKTKAKRYSVTTSAGIKIQPYFDVPPPNDPNLVYLRVQSEPSGDDAVILWVSAATAERLRNQLGSTDKDVVSEAAIEATKIVDRNALPQDANDNLAVAIHVSKEAFDALVEHWDAVNDDHRIQQLISALKSD